MFPARAAFISNFTDSLLGTFTAFISGKSGEKRQKSKVFRVFFKPGPFTFKS
jgi:hypothetical protein